MGIFKLNGIDYMGGGGGDVSKTELTQAEYNALVEAGTVNPEMMYFITDGPGSGGSGSYATLLWENATPTSGMSANTTVTIPNLTAFDLIGIVATHDVTGGSLYENAMQIFSTSNTTTYNVLVTATSGNASNYARTFTITNDTTLTFSDGMQPGIAYNFNYTVPLKIYGLRFGNGGSGGSNQHTYSTDEQVVGTWIDGSTIYEKTYTNISVSSGVHVIDSDLNVDTLVSIDGEIVDGDGLGYPIPYTYFYNSSINESIRIIADHANVWTTNKGIVYFYSGSTLSSIKAITIRYTKTTS